MIVALGQINTIIGDIQGNAEKIIQFILHAKERNAELIIFPELCVCGYPPEDLLLQQGFVEACEETVTKIASHCTGIAAIVGAPSVNKNAQQKPFYNTAWFLADGAIQACVHKTLLPDYDVFDEYRYFEANTTFSLVSYKDNKIALTICEDLWFDEENIYACNPLSELKKLQPDFLINIAASPFALGKQSQRHSLFSGIAEKLGKPILFVNAVGAQTDLLFDGHSCVYTHKGEQALALKSFQEDMSFVDLQQMQPLKTENSPPTEQLYDALIMGIRDYFSKMGFSKAILGLSGGVDSALTLVLATHALGAENISAVLMPSPFSSAHSISDSEALLATIPCQKIVLPITASYELLLSELQTHFSGKPSDVTEENMQARLRGLMLMALSNKHGSILLNTTNKSEMAVGYGTLYGDMCGGISVLGDVYKTQVYALCHYINRQAEIIPHAIISKAPSAELRPKQKDSDSLPDYELLDPILQLYIEEQANEEKIIEAGFDKSLVKKVLRLVQVNEYKRYQAAPVLRVSKKAFGRGRKIPLVARYS